jgi:hypothetical protein
MNGKIIVICIHDVVLNQLSNHMDNFTFTFTFTFTLTFLTFTLPLPGKHIPQLRIWKFQPEGSRKTTVPKCIRKCITTEFNYRGSLEDATSSAHRLLVRYTVLLHNVYIFYFYDMFQHYKIAIR